MSIIPGSSNGRDNHVSGDDMEETENVRFSSLQEDEYGDDFVEPYLTAYHLGNLDVDVPGEITSPKPEQGGFHASLSKDPADHDYTHIHDHDYTYIENTSVLGDTQDAKEDGVSDSVTSSGDCPSQPTEPLKNTSQEEQTAKILVCRIRHFKVAAIAIFVAASFIVGLLLMTGVIPPDGSNHTGSLLDWSNSSYTNLMSTGATKQPKTTRDMKDTRTPNMATKTFDVDGPAHSVTVSTSGKIAVALAGYQINIYNSEGVYLLQFSTVVVKRCGERTPISPHDVSFGAVNKDLWVVGGNNDSHYIATYDCDGIFKTGFAIRHVSAPRRLALSRLSNRAIVTETDGHRGEVKVFWMNGMLYRRFGRRQGLICPTAITVDNEDRILVADYYSANIFVYQDKGRFLFKFGGEGGNNGYLSCPLDICTDSSRRVIVADAGNKRMELFTSRGDLIRHIATDVDPLRIAVGPDGQLVLIEASKKKVTILMNY
ncbi:TRIM3 [Branchiostoma lanceolatum]|uniref:TRIM3 protein n=1 Tax=Branchiostoma lanceolatum TaxID=7740 RepID=A0A8K0AE59_BRALA|nr:TRIM3 [Branchiostoma lanceolatum]